MTKRSSADLALNENVEDDMDESRSRMVGLGGGARNAMEKWRSSEGDDGVTMIAGRGDFSVTSGRERSICEN